MANASDPLPKLRQRLRQRRRGLPRSQQSQTAQAVCQQALNSEVFNSATHVALYCATDGEVATDGLIELALQQGKQCYLPVVTEFDDLLFASFKKGQALHAGRWEIMQPDSSDEVINPRELDCVFVPLVGFDQFGNRLGMGKGFYDKAFAFLGDTDDESRKPQLIGLAHECQKVPDGTVGKSSWDIPLDTIFTGAQIYTT